MSSQKGNSQRSRPQKYQNRMGFRNNMHESNKRVLALNKLEIRNCCERCTQVIEWKIKYKKYKALTVPKKCVKCLQPKSIIDAYHVVCLKCVQSLRICAKCCSSTKPEDGNKVSSKSCGVEKESDEPDVCGAAASEDMGGEVEGSDAPDEEEGSDAPDEEEGSDAPDEEEGLDGPGDLTDERKDET